MGNIPNLIQSNPSPRPVGTPCTFALNDPEAKRILLGRNSQVDELCSGALLFPDDGGHLVGVGLARGHLIVLEVLIELHNLDLLFQRIGSDLE